MEFAVVGGRYVGGCVAGDGGRGLFVEVGDGANPEVGDEGVIICVESTILVADGLDEAGAAVERDARPYQAHAPRIPFPANRIECRDRSKRIRTAEDSALGANALDDVGERRIDVVRAFALDAVERLDDGTRTCIDGQNGVGLIYRSVVVCCNLCHHVRTGASFGDYSVDIVVGVLNQ